MDDTITVSIIIGYIYRYAFTFIICLLGSFVKDCYDTVTKGSRINIIKILSASMFTSFILCAVYDYIHVTIALYVFIAFFVGLWGFVIMEGSINLKVIIVFVKNIGKNLTNPVANGVADSIKELQEEAKEEKAKQEEKEKKNENNNSPSE